MLLQGWRRACCVTSKRARPPGRFTVPDAGIALSAVAGGLLGLLRQLERDPEHDRAIVDQVAEGVLRMLGIPAAEAARLAAVPLPEIGGWQ
jgi:hypothetical protein